MSRCLVLVGAGALELREVAAAAPGPGELVVRIDAATTCGTDLKVFRRGGHPRMLTVPSPFGHELTGTVSARGAGVAAWREGDAVVVANSASCGACAMCVAGRENLCLDLCYLNGAYADELVVPERFVRRSTRLRPPGLAPRVAAMAEPLACVLHGLSACPPDDGRTVLVLGAGPIGLMFVAELAAAGRRVALADLRAGRLETGVHLGAAATALMSGDEAADLARAASVGPSLVVEATGSPAGWRTAMAAVGAGGTVVLFGGCPPETVATCDGHLLHYSEVTVRGVYHHRPATFARALERLAERPAVYAHLLQGECGLGGVEAALARMGAGEILKAAVIPALDA